MKPLRMFVAISLMSCGLLPARAAETLTYTYDAKGRVVKVQRSGTINNGVKSEYVYDKVTNRKNLKVTGSPNPPP